MHLLVAFDKFKDSMSAPAACERAAEAARTALGEDIRLTQAPLTDGGEGFCTILTEAAGGWVERHEVCGPLGEPVLAPLGWIEAGQLPDGARGMLRQPAGRIAIIEMASAAGLEQVPPDRRHPRRCSSRGVGELIRIATAQEASAVLLGIGGSATSDLGLGALEALGFRFPGTERIIPGDWPRIDRMERTDFPAPPIFIACDVDNPLCGPQGAAAVYGPQKGLAPGEVEAFDAEAGRIADLLCDCCGQDPALKDLPGSGAAGGIGFGLKAAFGADFLPGFDLVARWLALDAKIAAADLILSGEGTIDSSSLSGKGPCALAKAAHEARIPCHLFAGRIETDARRALAASYPQTSTHEITPADMPLEDALRHGPENLGRRVAEVLKSHASDT